MALSFDPLVTIAIPTRNRPDYLRIAIESAINQSYPNIEVLVSDNASEDDNSGVLAGAQNPRLRTWTQPVNLGMAGNWNFLLEQARGEYFCLLSDDDFLYPDFAACMVNCFRNSPGAALAYSGCEIKDGISTFVFTGYPTREPGLAVAEGIIKGSRTIFLCSMLFPTEPLRRGGGFPNHRFSADSAAWLPLLMSGDAAHDPRVLSHYTAQTGSISANLPIADSIGDLEKLVQLCSSDPRVPPHLQKRFLSVGHKMLAQKASRLLFHRAALGTPKSTLVRALPSISRYIAYDYLAALPAVVLALLLPASVMRRAKSLFREKRSGANPPHNH